MTTSSEAAPRGSEPAPAEPTPAASEEFARVNNRLTVHDYLPRTFHDGTAAAGKCEWSSHVCVDLTLEEAGALAWVLVDTIMSARFGRATHLHAEWRQHTLEGTKLAAPRDRLIGSFVAPVFGLPGAAKSDDHLHGHVGEWLWHLLTKDNPAVRVQPDPKGDVTDAGSDGFSIYETGTGELRFRLWESKKNTGSGSLAASLNRAYAQLEGHGQRYVAKIVGAFGGVSSETPNEVKALVTDLPEAWLQGDKLVGAGVMLATHQDLPATPFTGMAIKLPLLDKPGQLRGLVTSLSCFVEIAMMVRRYAWTAL
ncbi:hypothetical protein [Cellulomonas sp. HD19AZ1]|uniref:hypothetical protein n=1 Tax=Cellulomonas sp. HD19AZ1 TaxID=2559593 RepID=UPI001071530B|nr:hypothetical protein [Cellulomonas sp. HD19AZ1]TFH68201.1 hypothetical protein E4A51_16940 [Cellulomonas sp. HD19AZ1]